MLLLLELALLQSDREELKFEDYGAATYQQPVLQSDREELKSDCSR